jgi:hypothetical protein
MAEWFKAAVLKTVVPHGTVGSNPTLSALVNPSDVHLKFLLNKKHGMRSKVLGVNLLASSKSHSLRRLVLARGTRPIRPFLIAVRTRGEGGARSGSNPRNPASNS